MKLTKREKEFCRLYSKYGGNMELICRDMGIGTKAFERYMQQGSVKEYLSCAMQQARDSLTASLPSVVNGLLEMFNSADTDPKVRVAIAQQILDRTGMVHDRTVNLNVSVNTSISDRARELLSQRLTIDTTADPVPQTPAIPNGDYIIGRKLKNESENCDENAVIVQDFT